MTLQVTNINFESLLDKKIDEINFIGDYINLGNQELYYISKPKINFIDVDISQIVFSTDNNKKIINVIIFFPSLLDKSFFEIMCKKYKHTDEIFVFDQVVNEGDLEDFANEFSGNFKETKVSLKKGSINDKVDTIYWDMIKYRITLNYRYIDNTTVIYFSKINQEY